MPGAVTLHENGNNFLEKMIYSLENGYRDKSRQTMNLDIFTVRFFYSGDTQTVFAIPMAAEPQNICRKGSDNQYVRCSAPKYRNEW
jgi:hypothetical protein